MLLGNWETASLTNFSLLKLLRFYIYIIPNVWCKNMQRVQMQKAIARLDLIENFP